MLSIDTDIVQVLYIMIPRRSFQYAVRNLALQVVRSSSTAPSATQDSGIFIGRSTRQRAIEAKSKTDRAWRRAGVTPQEALGLMAVPLFQTRIYPGSRVFQFMKSENRTRKL